MTNEVGTASHTARPRWSGGLTKRDFVRIPLLAAATMVVLLIVVGVGEVAARKYMPGLPGSSCYAIDYATGVSHGVPNCSNEFQIPGGPRALFSYNQCGYRNPSAACGPKAADTKRIVLVGASFPEGYPIGIKDSFAAKLEPLLTHSCGSPVEVENLGAMWNDIVGSWRQFDEALALKPDIILYSATPTDFWSYDIHKHFLDRNNAVTKERRVISSNHIENLIKNGADSFRITALIKEFYYADNEYYIRSQLDKADSSDYLRVPFSSAWEQRLADIDALVADMARRSEAQGTRFGILFAPSRLQAAIIGLHSPIPNVDPYALMARLKAIADRHGTLFIDTTHDIGLESSPERLYLTVDGHPNANGHTVIANSIAKVLTSSSLSPFAACKALDLAAH